NALSPVPVSTMARIDASAAACCTPALIPSITDSLMALRRSGRLMVIHSALPRTSTRTGSACVIVISPSRLHEAVGDPALRHGDRHFQRHLAEGLALGVDAQR